ncbi:hypothetical protein NDI85_11695 [Halomicroarcula sp. S1AR25-4]|uniref:hypothetical protein n=1 Tax=Haloarcula sp. S1AR25-4 TaxID=2950538 RepID=UPI0028761F77|nr:hypothetical protein [Halomicroarcula sp. S1AR25-4]MDS0278461.1 hypothetical protein [Halomicroarcula sp. S1AR25-4]
MLQLFEKPFGPLVTDTVGLLEVVDIGRVEVEYDAVETAPSELTDTGSEVYVVDEAASFTDRLVAASTNGDDPDAFPQLVATAFSWPGFEAQWIDGGNLSLVAVTGFAFSR